MKIIIVIVALLGLAIAGYANKGIHVPTYNSAGLIERGYGEAALPDSGIYKGQFADGLFNGMGEMVCGITVVNMWVSSSQGCSMGRGN